MYLNIPNLHAFFADHVILKNWRITSFNVPALRMRLSFDDFLLDSSRGITSRTTPFLVRGVFHIINLKFQQKRAVYYLCFSCNRCYVANFFSPESVDDRALANIRVTNNTNTATERNKFLLQYQYNINHAGEENIEHHHSLGDNDCADVSEEMYELSVKRIPILIIANPVKKRTFLIID